MNVGKIHMKKASAMFTNETIRHNMIIYNCLGDPSMEIYTEKPTDFDLAIVTKEPDKIVVQPGEDAIVSFYNVVTHEVHSFLTDGAVVIYNCNPTNYIVSLNYHNKIPLVEMPRESLYIQNQSILGNCFFNAQKVHIGSNVTNEITNGPVKFRSGNIRISANEVEIKGETTIQIGTNFEITTAE